MSKKLKISSLKLKNVSDPKLARFHNKGSSFELVQSSLDKKWGRYYFNHYNRYLLYFERAGLEYNETMKTLSVCRKIKVDTKTSIRHIEDKMRDDLELHSALFLILIKLGFEYMTNEILPTVNRIMNRLDNTPIVEWEQLDINDRLNSLTKMLNSKTSVPLELYNLFDRRDIVEHPTQDRLYNMQDNNWKNNHLAWVLSGEIEDVFDSIVNFVNEQTILFEKYVIDNPMPGKLLGVQRGIKAGEQFKK